MRIDDNVREANTNAWEREVTDMATEMNISYELADAIKSYYAAYLFSGNCPCSQEYSEMLEIADKYNVSEQECEDIYYKYNKRR